MTALPGPTERFLSEPLLIHRALDTLVARAQRMARDHYAMLNAASVGASPMRLRQIARMREQVRKHAAWDDVGMLGENGIAPAVRDVCGERL